MIELKIVGDAATVRQQVLELFALGLSGAVLAKASEAVPAVSDTSSDNTTAESRKPRKPRSVVASVAETKPEPQPEPQPEQNISANPENREPPAAEPQPEAPKEPEKVYTLDDVRNAAGPYVKKFGPEAAAIDLQPCLKAATDGKADRISLLDPADQATLKAAIAAFNAASAAEKRFGQ